MLNTIYYNWNALQLYLPKCFASFCSLICILHISSNSFSQQLHIGPGAYLVMNGHSVLGINNASFKNDGNIIADSGTLRFTGNADTSIAYISGASPSTINNLRINKSAFGLALKSSLIVKDTVSILPGILYSNGHLTLKSTAEKTATVAALPVDGAGIATAYIAGDVNIERYIKARKAWRFLSAPVKNSGATPTINSAWQEGVNAGNPNAGYGIHIIGGSASNGFDLAPTTNPSLKVYDNATDNITPIPNIPGTHIPISSYPGYFAFVWGNRSTNLFGNAVATHTTLRMKGEIKTGNQVVTVNPFKYTVLGNPYPSAIDFGLLDKTNVRNAFYAWDPMLAGAYGVGGYVTVSWNGSSYDVTANSSGISQCIPSGSAVLIQSEDSATAGSVIVTESSKIFCEGQGPLARNQLNERVNLLLYEANANSSRILMDAVLTTYADHFLNETDHYDVVKMGTKYLGLKRGNDLFAIERRKTITAHDTIFLVINALSSRNYQLNVIINKMEYAGLQAIFKDNYAAELDNKPLNMNDSNAINFQVNSDPASYASNRFFIIFQPLVTVPIPIANVQAARAASGIAVTWQVENEINIKQYVLEKSYDGIVFSPLQTLQAKAMNGGKEVYEYLDKAIVNGDHFYRVRLVYMNAATANTNIVKVTVAGLKDIVQVFPNPVEGNVINIQAKNLPGGTYTFNLINASGQTIYSKRATLNNNQKISLHLNETLPAGIYQLETRAPEKVIHINKIVRQKAN